MKCTVCDQEFANSEDLKAHMERDHTLEERDDELEKPDMLSQEEEQAAEGPPGGVIPGKNN